MLLYIGVIVFSFSKSFNPNIVVFSKDLSKRSKVPPGRSLSLAEGELITKRYYKKYHSPSKGLGGYERGAGIVVGFNAYFLSK